MTLTTADWLVWLGVQQPQRDVSEIRPDIALLRDSVGDWSSFQSGVDGSADYAELEGNLESTGFPADRTGEFTSKCQQNIGDFTTFSNTVSSLNSYIEFQKQYGNHSGVAGRSTTDSGAPVAGIRVHDSAGVSFSGVDVPAGTTEVFGQRIEFSETRGGVSVSGANYANFTVTDTTPTVGREVGFSADVTNPNSDTGIPVSVSLTEDGEVVRSVNVRLQPGETREVSFALTKFGVERHTYRIGSSSSATVTWIPSPVVPFF